jgi:hypothetical protein
VCVCPPSLPARPPARAQLESVLNTLEERLRQYHACCHRLALLPATAKRAGGVSYEMCVNRGASCPQELISGDIKVCVCAVGWVGVSVVRACRDAPPFLVCQGGYLNRSLVPSHSTSTLLHAVPLPRLPSSCCLSACCCCCHCCCC